MAWKPRIGALLPCIGLRGSSATSGIGTSRLNRRALDRAVGAEYAAVSGEGFEQHAAAFALVEVLARIERHLFTLGVAAFGTGKRG